MPRKTRFKPEIKRIKLNPEQAVLACSCHNGQRWLSTTSHPGYPGTNDHCNPGGKYSSRRPCTTTGPVVGYRWQAVASSS